METRQNAVVEWQKTPAVVVTLRRCTSRAVNVMAIQQSCPLTCELWEATDGALLDTQTVAQFYQPKLHRPHYPFALRPGEIGCFLSHRRIWQYMVDNKIDRMLIVEDDVSFLPNFAASLQQSIEQAVDGSYVQFQVRQLKQELAAPIHSPMLHQPTLAPLRTSAQLVTLGAAEKLLRFTQQFDRPIDAAIQLTWLHGANVLVSLPRSLIEVSADLGGSTIGSKKSKPFASIIQREWKRSWYRYCVATTAKRFAQSTCQNSVPLKQTA